MRGHINLKRAVETLIREVGARSGSLRRPGAGYGVFGDTLHAQTQQLTEHR